MLALHEAYCRELLKKERQTLPFFKLWTHNGGTICMKISYRHFLLADQEDSV